MKNRRRSSAHPWQLIPAARTAAATGRYGDTVIRALTDLAVPTWGHKQSSLQMRSAVQHAVASVLANDRYPQCGRCLWITPSSHLLITVLLCGLWLPIWIIIAATDKGVRRHQVTVDEYGASIGLTR